MAELLMLERRMLNDRLMSSERGFLDTEGLSRRHLVSIFVFLFLHTVLVSASCKIKLI